MEYGFGRVRLPGRRDVELTLVVVKGFGQVPLLLLTNVTVKGTRRSVWNIVQGYLTRWLMEETIRFIKQSYRLEDLRVLDYERLRNLAALVMAAAYFAAVWLDESLKLAVLASRSRVSPNASSACPSSTTTRWPMVSHCCFPAWAACAQSVAPPHPRFS